ncbi:MAG: MFS transporter [Gammaproteobacteria bacterium]
MPAPDFPARLRALTRTIARIEAAELRAVVLAFSCNFALLGGYYILRPVRDVMATVFGVAQLQNLYTGTLVLTLLCAPAFAWLTTRFKLTRVIPGMFWFWISNILVFYLLFNAAPDSRWVAAAYYWWFSVVNLFMISIFWSLMVDLFSAAQATRLFALIAAGGSIGAIAGPVVTTLFVSSVGVSGLLLIAAADLVVVIGLVHLLMREKSRLQTDHVETQTSTLDQKLSGNPFAGFSALFESGYIMNQALFIMLMTWVATVAYFLQTDLISQAFSDIADRTVALADIDLAVNILSALLLVFGVGRFVTRFGVTAGLFLNPVIMALAFVAIALSPTLLMIQAIQIVRRVSQYAIARPSREICFTVVPQESRYKAKNVIDTVVYRFGDLTAAWMQGGLRMLGFGLSGAVGMGLLTAGAWGAVAVALGRRYERLRADDSDPVGT